MNEKESGLASMEESPLIPKCRIIVSRESLNGKNIAKGSRPMAGSRGWIK